MKLICNGGLCNIVNDNICCKDCKGKRTCKGLCENFDENINCNDCIEIEEEIHAEQNNPYRSPNS